MEWIVLGLLQLSDATIYELNSAFKMGISLIYSASYGTLQHAVKKLLKQEHITFDEKVEKGRNKKIYKSTAAGRDAFFQWMFEPVNRKKIESAMLSKVYFLGLIEKREDKLHILNDIEEGIEEIETELLQLQEEVSRFQLTEEMMKIAKYQFKTLDYGIRAHSSGKQWVRDLKKEIL